MKTEMPRKTMRRFFTACILLGLVGPAYANETALKENEVPPPVIAAVKEIPRR